MPQHCTPTLRDILRDQVALYLACYGEPPPEFTAPEIPIPVRHLLATAERSLLVRDVLALLLDRARAQRAA